MKINRIPGLVNNTRIINVIRVKNTLGYYFLDSVKTYSIRNTDTDTFEEEFMITIFFFYIYILTELVIRFFNQSDFQHNIVRY